MGVRVHSTKTAGRGPAAQASSKPATLLIGEPADAFEQEADRIADQLMTGTTTRGWSIGGGGVSLQRKCACGGAAPCEKCRKESADDEKVRRKAEGPARSGEAPPIVHEVLRSPGQRLDPAARSFFESRLGHDFARIQVHTGGRAADSARAIDAIAYTVGDHVVFGRGQYQPHSPDGLKLLAHELVHTVQQDAGRASRKVVQRGTSPGWADAKPGTLNASEGPPIGKIRRIPIEDLKEGNQAPNAASGEESAKGRAIILLHKDFDPTSSADVLFFFHGHNEGFRSGPKGYRDKDVYQLESQLEDAGKKQVIGILPQGTRSSGFGGLPSGIAPTVCNGSKLEKSFNTDAYITEVFDKLTALKIWTAKPTVGSVGLSGHSGGGELINQGLLGGGAGSSLPQSIGTLREVALFDAINGPCEFLSLQDWLERTLKKELADLKAKNGEAEQRKYLTTSIRFRSYFETSKAIGDFYSRWNVGPLPISTWPKLLTGKKALKPFLDEWFKTNTTGLPPNVVSDWTANYVIIDKGAVAHDNAQPNILTEPNAQKDRPFTEAVKVMPKREEGAPAAEAEAPDSVRDAIESPARSLSVEENAWASSHFGRDFSRVRVHTGSQAAESARAIRSLAYTVGRHVVLDPSRYREGTPSGQRLLGHELTHVAQQGSAEPSRNARLALGPAGDALEREADRRSSVPGPVGGRPAAPGALVQAAPAEGKLAKTVCETTQNPPPEQPGECNYARPENCPTYESWIETFVRLKSFAARATPSPGTLTSSSPHTFDVLGDAAATRFEDPVSEKAMAKDPKAAPVPTTGLKPGETFIDHPTDAWVKACLPDNLRATAYQLPADCADIAIILRHVWLSAHQRTQVIQVGKDTWTIGDAAGGPGRTKALKAISDLGSRTVTELVQPYSDPQGNPLVTFKELAPLLHPGDILVWEHRDKGLDKGRTGGHTLTITDVRRDDTGKIVSMAFVQGNEPIFGDADCDPGDKDASGLCPSDDKGKIIKKLGQKDSEKLRKQLGESPGRRIEAVSTTGSRPNGIEVNDPDIDLPPKKKGAAPTKVWGWESTTILLAAGPPRAAVRPPMAKPAKGATAERRITDWSKSFAAAASYADWQAVWEAMLLEARAFLEGGRDIPESEARQIGDAAGKRLWTLAKVKGSLGDETHYRRVVEAEAVISALGESRKPLQPVSRDLTAPWDQLTTKILRTLSQIEDSFELAARGASDISFAAGKSVVKVLMTGFDPFDPSGSLKAPSKGTWNPAGAAVLALDNQSVPVKSSAGAGGTASVQGIVLPVDYDKFQAGGKGLVESVVTGGAADLDAAITVSMDPNLGPTAPVRLERYVVGTHNVPRTNAQAQTTQKLEPIPPAGGGGAGDEIIESNAPLARIAADTEKGKAIPKPDIGETVTLRFADAATAKKAATALHGAGSPGSKEVEVSDEKALREIINTMVRKPNGIDIAFRAGGGDFTATVVSGPGGNFLSNEVSYRMLRLLKEKKFPQDPLSFHVHTQGADVIPQDVSTTEATEKRTSALKAATGLLGRLIETLKRIVAATSKVILDRRAKK